jgi:vitamin B12 transporter
LFTRRATLYSLALTLALASPPAWAEDASSVSIVIEGERDPGAGARDASVSSTVLGRDQLEAPGHNAATVLRGAPGVAITELGGLGASASTSIRGASAAQTPVYLAGVRINDEVAGSADLATLPLWFIERIEIYRGNAPADADRWGLGGAVFFEPKKPDGKLTTGALVGSHGTLGAYATVSAGTASDGVIAGVGYEAAENDYRFEDSQGTAFVGGDDSPARLSNADASLFGFWLHGRQRLGRTSLNLLAHRGSLERGVARVANVPAEQAREQVERNLAAISTRSPFGAHDGWVEARTTLLSSTTSVRDPARELSLGTTASEVRGLRVSEGLAVRFRPLPPLLLRAAIDASAERASRREASGGVWNSRPVLEASRVDLRPAASSELDLGNQLSLRALLAVECTSASTSSLEPCPEHPLSGRLGPSFRAGKLTAFANAGRYARSPTLGERFGMSAVVRGNPRLDSESGTSVDVGARFHDSGRPGIWLSGAAFARWARSLIVFTRTAQGYVVPENRDRARLLGLELALGAAPVDGLNLGASLSLTDARDTSESRFTVNDVLPFQSRLQFAPGVSYTHTVRRSFVDAVKLVAHYVHQSSRYADGAGLAVIPEQGNLELQGELAFLRWQSALRVRVDNVFDQQRFDVVGFPLPGTTFFASFEARL